VSVVLTAKSSLAQEGAAIASMSEKIVETYSALVIGAHMLPDFAYKTPLFYTRRAGRKVFRAIILKIF
jgi:hypothetical protein